MNQEDMRRLLNSEKRFHQINCIGVVQSVGFRPFLQKLAVKQNINGFTRNLADAGVEIVIQGDLDTRNKFIRGIREEKPELAVILDITYKHISISEIRVEDHQYLQDGDFHILKSKLKGDGKTDKGFSAIPPDVAICNSCLEDMVVDGSRKNYAFTSCTDCGPRYSAIYNLPYDRPRTAFAEFPLCEPCDKEYTDIRDRRLHAQTTCCEVCGPQYERGLDTEQKTGEIIGKSDWNTISSKIADGETWAIMGISGTHLICNAKDIEVTRKLRESKRKETDKPFAVMMPDIDTVKRYCKTSKKDEKLLLSARKPIIILPLIDPDLEIWENISPGLSTLGVMLPYTGLHPLLFLDKEIEILVMTSANELGIPMPIAPAKVIEELKGLVDNIVVHNRPIAQRVDDSVIRSHYDHHLIIRRSRGYVPQPLYHKGLVDIPDTVALGAEENNTGAIMKNGWIVPTQHIGHIDNVECYDFLGSSLTHLQDLFRVNPEQVVLDMHPAFLNRKLLEKYQDTKAIEVQHHVAHVASLALDNNLPHHDPLLAWASDGFGYGADGQAWGNELILLDPSKKGGWERLASGYKMRYDGFDMNAKFPARMFAYYMQEINENPRNYITDKNHLEVLDFKYGDMELKQLEKQVHQEPKMWTSSLARFLDSVSYMLGISKIRSYRGEPAIKLEDIALFRTPNQDFSFSTDNYILREDGIDLVHYPNIFSDLIDLEKSGVGKGKIAQFAHVAVGRTMADLAIQQANQLGIRKIGFTGGVAYNYILTSKLRKEIQDNKLEFLIHNNLPPGDAGTSAGQLNFLGYLL